MINIKEDIRVELSSAGEVGISNPKAGEGLLAGTMVPSGVSDLRELARRMPGRGDSRQKGEHK